MPDQQHIETIAVRLREAERTRNAIAPVRGEIAPDDVAAAYAVQQVNVDARLAELTHLRDQLTELRRQCVGEHSVEDCGIVHGLATMETVAPAAKRSHLG